ncbi:MAG: IS3 family transposase [Pyrinomonadaceae bacterium]|nr:IS3 family transposase [Pyrinomonadaceae bacterium]
MKGGNLKKGGTHLRQGKLERYWFIENQKSFYPIKALCRVMKVQRSAYYAYASRRTYRKSAWQKERTAQVKECFQINRRRYGSRRIAASLKIGRTAVQKVMRRENLKAIQPKSFKPQTTDSRHGLAVCANLLQDGTNAPRARGEVFVGDITYLRLQDGKFCYLACLQDKFTRRIVGWKVSSNMTVQFIIDVFAQARQRGLIGRKAIIHTNQGSQYAVLQYRRLLYIGFRQSMSCKRNCL